MLQGFQWYSAFSASRIPLEPDKHEEVAIYAINQQISNVCRIAEVYVGNGAVRSIITKMEF